jgi:hypothetical protein
VVKINGVRRRGVSVDQGGRGGCTTRTGAPIYQKVKLLNNIEHPALIPGKPVAVYLSSLGGLNYSPSSFDPTTGYLINSQAETGVVLQQANPKLIDRYKIRDVDNGL